MLIGFRLFFSGDTAIIKSVFIFFDVASNYKYIRVFKLLAYLNAGAYTAVLPRGLRAYNLLLLKGPFYLRVMAFYRVFIEFLFKLLQNFKKKR